MSSLPASLSSAHCPSHSNSIMAEGKRERRVIAEDDAKIVFETSEEVSVTPTFDSMKIREDLLRGIYAYGKLR